MDWHSIGTFEQDQYTLHGSLTPERAAALPSLEADHPELRSLSLSLSSPLDGPALERPIDLKRLKVHLSVTVDLAGKALDAFGQAIEGLDLNGSFSGSRSVEVTDRHAALVARLPGLVALDLGGGRMTPGGFIQAIEGLERLEVLTPPSGPWTDAVFDALPTSLRVIHSLRLSPGQIAKLTRLLRLELLNLDVEGTDEPMDGFEGMGALRSLHLWLPGGQTRAGFLRHLGGLHELRLHGGKGLKASEAPHFGHLPALEVLELGRLKTPDAAFLALAKGSPGLRHASTFSGAVTDQGATALAALPRMTTLGLRGKKITDATLRALDGHPALRCLALSGASITASELGVLSTTPLEHLTLMHMALGAALIPALTGLPGLKHIGVPRCGLSKPEIKTLKAALPPQTRFQSSLVSEHLAIQGHWSHREARIMGLDLP